MPVSQAPGERPKGPSHACHSEPPQPRAANRRRPVPARRFRRVPRGPTSFSGSTSTRPTPAKASSKARRSPPTAPASMPCPAPTYRRPRPDMAYLIGAIYGDCSSLSVRTDSDRHALPSQARMTLTGARSEPREPHQCAVVWRATLTDADFTDAEIRGASFDCAHSDSRSHGFILRGTGITLAAALLDGQLPGA